MDSKVILNLIRNVSKPADGYMAFTNNGECYFGLDNNGFLVFMMPSSFPNILPMTQNTNSLQFDFNKKCRLKINNQDKYKTMHVLTCKDSDEDKQLAFIRLTYAFSSQDSQEDQYFLVKLFSIMSNLFDKVRQVSDIELQGLYAELYTILYLKDNGIDIGDYWQSKNKMKFDFSLNERKRIEIKSTLKAERIHHFKHEQLLSNLYEIKIVSIQLQRNDCGLSLLELVNRVIEEYSDNFLLLAKIEDILSNVSKSDLSRIKYDKIYTDQKIRFFDAVNIPHFNEKTPEGVFNAEYDCSLDGVKELSLDDLKQWIKGV